jgi:hypothetical protein
MTTEVKPNPLRAWKVPTGIAIGLLLYVMSMGPVCKLCFEYRLSPGVLQVYWPIWQLSAAPGPGRAMAAYLNLWGSRWKASYWNSEHGIVIGSPSFPILPP